MKQFVFALSFMISANAFAGSDFSKTMELCALQSSSDDEVYHQAFSETSLYINKAKAVSAVQLKLINQHLLEQEYVTAPLKNLAEVQALFTTGDQQYNDLYLITMTSKTSGTVYHEVKSYPGDNPYSLVFSAKGQLVAMNRDQNITLVNGQESFDCPWE
ncbi:hypothetical protein [Bdellovibrio sp. HCB288]|uniref:hypothetical protein n=1 Tax=Bdellovibrio sp. HCB288 TaxID=3394355 RepID=UPI0039B6C29E